jgi:hypothetical protein
MYFQLLFEVALVILVVYFIWRLVLRPKAEKFVRSKENSRLQIKMDLLRDKRAALENLQAERDVTKELKVLEKEVAGVQKELDRLEKNGKING